MRRRNLLGGAVWLLWIPTAVYAQRADARCRVGMLIALSSDPEEQLEGRKFRRPFSRVLMR
jgi:hypothetical protein